MRHQIATCLHNTMKARRGDLTHAWECADCGYIYGQPRFYLCGSCDHYHPLGWKGDCRDDSQRFTTDQLDARYPDRDGNGQGWLEVEEV